MKIKTSLAFVSLILQLSCGSVVKKDSAPFESYIQNFPTIELPVNIRSEDDFYLKNPALIDSNYVKDFLLSKGFGNTDFNPLHPVYYYGTFPLSTEFTSVIVYQFYQDEAFSHFYFLINYKPDGTIISTKTIASRSDALTWFKLDAKIEVGHLSLLETLSHRDMEDNPDKIEYTCSFVISNEGNFEPIPFKKELLTDWDKVVKRGDHFVLKEFELSLGIGHDKLHFNKEGKRYTLEYELPSHNFFYEVVAFKASKKEYVLIVKMVSDPVIGNEEELHFRYINEEKNITLWNSNDHLEFPTAYFTANTTVSDFDVEYGESEGGGVAIPLYALVSEKGVGEILLGSKLESLKKFYSADKIRIETEETEMSDINVYNIYGDNEKALLTITPDKQKVQVQKIMVYGKSFKTENNIGVGSTYSELIKAYKNTSVIGGEEGVLVTVNELKNVIFTMDGKNLNWVPDQEVNIPGDTKVQYIIVTK